MFRRSHLLALAVLLTLLAIGGPVAAAQDVPVVPAGPAVLPPHGPYYSEDTPVLIYDDPDANSLIDVPDNFQISTAVVTITASFQDLRRHEIWLISPDGIAVLLVPLGLPGAALTNTRLDDSATRPVVQGVAPYTGIFRPADPERLASLAGYWSRTEDGSAGTWDLNVAMFDYQYTLDTLGSIDSWSISFNTAAYPFKNYLPLLIRW